MEGKVAPGPRRAGPGLEGPQDPTAARLRRHDLDPGPAQADHLREAQPENVGGDLVGSRHARRSRRRRRRAHSEPAPRNDIRDDTRGPQGMTHNVLLGSTGGIAGTVASPEMSSLRVCPEVDLARPPTGSRAGGRAHPPIGGTAIPLRSVGRTGLAASMTPSPTRPTISVGLATDADRFLATEHAVWFLEVPTASTEEQLLGLPEDQRFAAEVDGADPSSYPGVYGVFPMALSIPGPNGGLSPVPCAGLSWVGVHPDHRRRGILTAMMQHHVEQVHEEAGTHVSALHASEPAIYGRHGYGLASLELQVELGRAATLTAPELEDAAEGVTTRFATVTDTGAASRLRDCHRRAAGLGAVVGDIGYYERICFQPPEELRDKESWRVLFARRDGDDVGFALFRRTHKWEKSRPAGELSVWLLVGEPAAQLVLLRRLVDFDLMGSVSIGKVGIDDPLLLWTGGPALDGRRRDVRQPVGAPRRPARGVAGPGVDRSRATSSSRWTTPQLPGTRARGGSTSTTPARPPWSGPATTRT